MKDINGVTLIKGGRIKTKSGKIAYIISLHEDSARVRVRFNSGQIKKLYASDVERF